MFLFSDYSIVSPLLNMRHCGLWVSNRHLDFLKLCEYIFCVHCVLWFSWSGIGGSCVLSCWFWRRTGRPRRRSSRPAPALWSTVQRRWPNTGLRTALSGRWPRGASPRVVSTKTPLSPQLQWGHYCVTIVAVASPHVVLVTVASLQCHHSYSSITTTAWP